MRKVLSEARLLCAIMNPLWFARSLADGSIDAFELVWYIPAFLVFWAGVAFPFFLVYLMASAIFF